MTSSIVSFAKHTAVAQAEQVSVSHKAFRNTNPEYSRRNKKRDAGLNAEPLLIGHKGSSYQNTAAAIGMQNHTTRMRDER